MMTSRDEKAGDANRRAPLEKLAFRRTISIPAEVRVPGASRKGPQTSADFLGFVPIQFTSTPTNQNSILFIHTFLLSSFWVRCRSQALQKVLSGPPVSGHRDGPIH